jgi:paraquat-inducible protein A
MLPTVAIDRQAPSFAIQRAKSVEFLPSHRLLVRALDFLGKDMASIVACSACGLVQRFDSSPAASVAECSRCGSVVARRKNNSLERTAAFSVAALVLYLPANLYPILRMDFHGFFTENTVWDGCVKLFQDGQWFVAVVVFAASILIPLLKLLGLFFLVLTTKSGFQWMRRGRTRIYKVIEAIGRWAMLDVFMLAILVSLAKLGRIATVTPGPGLLAFASVVVLTILASASFEPRLIWEQPEKSHEEGKDSAGL